MVDLFKAVDLAEMVEASLMLEDPSFLLDNWEEGEVVRAVSQWEDETYQVLKRVLSGFIKSGFTLKYGLKCHAHMSLQPKIFSSTFFCLRAQ